MSGHQWMAGDRACHSFWGWGTVIHVSEGDQRTRLGHFLNFLTDSGDGAVTVPSDEFHKLVPLTAEAE